MNFDTYLNAMQGKCSMDTIKAIDLLQIGQSQTELLADLEQMYQRGMINRASVTRNGQTDLVVWPTGVRKPYNAKTDFKISPPKREETVIKPNIAPVDHPVQKEAPAAAEKPTSLLSIAQFVHNKQKVTKDEIYKEFPTPNGRKNDYVYKLIWQLNKEQIISVQKANLAKDDIVTIGPQYENYLAKLQKKQPKGPVIKMPTADEYKIFSSHDPNKKLITGKVSLNISAQPTIQDCVRIIQSQLPKNATLNIENHEDIAVYTPLLSQALIVDFKNLSQALATLKKLEDLVVTDL